LRNPDARGGHDDHAPCATSGLKRCGSGGYAIEELIADHGAAFLCADLDLSLEPRDDHASYIATWLNVVKQDNRAIFTARKTPCRPDHFATVIRSRVFACTRPSVRRRVSAGPAPSWDRLTARAIRKSDWHAHDIGAGPRRPFGLAPPKSPRVGFLWLRRNRTSRNHRRPEMAKTKGAKIMTVKFFPNDKGNPPGKLADAELHFSGGPLDGLKLVGFALWERKGGGRNVTFPARQYSVNGERRSFALLRPIVDATSQDRLRDIILEAHKEHEAEIAAIA
jgi:hypothetical protein